MSESDQQQRAADPAPGTIAVDPVCKMEVEIATAPATARLGEQTYYFCNPACRQDFLRDPASYGVAGTAG